MTTANELGAQISERLAAAGDPQRASQRQAYLKSTMPCHGVANPVVRLIVRDVLNQCADLDRELWRELIRIGWQQATHREERLAAIEVANARRKWARPDLMGLYRQMAITGAWWDLVDPLATHLVAEVLRRDAGQAAVLRDWAVADDQWLRRVAILAQLGFGIRTDPELLHDVLVANLQDSPFGTRFFIRKAVGWALRGYARVNPGWVRAFVADYDGRLAALSRREALKHLTPDQPAVPGRDVSSRRPGP